MTTQSHSIQRIRTGGVSVPTQTFFNLPDTKRQAIIDIAIDEFAEHGFKNASISRMVASAGIAKGSFYQYFTDKEDLLLYLIRLAGEEKFRFIQGLQPPNPQMGLFPYIYWLMDVGIRFTFAHPKLAQVVSQALRDTNAIQSDTVKNIRGQSTAYYRQLVQMGVAAGEVDPAYDPDLVAFMLSVMTTELGFQVLSGLDLSDREALLEQYTSRIKPQFLEMIQILEQGLRPR